MPSFSLYLNGASIPHGDQIKYLGVTIANGLKWNTHIINVIRKANKVLGMIRRCLGPASTKTCMNAFNSVVRPILEYASQVWAPFNLVSMWNAGTIQTKREAWHVFPKSHVCAFGRIERHVPFL